MTIASIRVLAVYQVVVRYFGGYLSSLATYVVVRLVDGFVLSVARVVVPLPVFMYWRISLIPFF
jgi:hypothetical protein